MRSTISATPTQIHSQPKTPSDVRPHIKAYVMVVHGSTMKPRTCTTQLSSNASSMKWPKIQKVSRQTRGQNSELTRKNHPYQWVASCASDWDRGTLAVSGVMEFVMACRMLQRRPSRGIIRSG